MSFSFWLITFFIIQVIHFAGTWKLYQKAGRKAWEAIVPVYNAYILMKIIQRPVWWVVLLFIPVINLIIFPVIWVETLRSFGKNKAQDTWLGVVTLGFYIFAVNYNDTVEFIEERDLTPKSETTSSILFAVVVATLVHTYIMQPYIIPTSSLEKSLLVGDFLFVSKFHYGARTPITPVSLPMVHDTIPFLKKKSYLSELRLPNFRFPAIQDIKRTDIVVFNWPADTVRYFGDTQSYGIRKPIDKKSNYVKRCVGIPGDSLSIVDGFVYINGKQLELPDRAKPQYKHVVYSKNGVSADLIKKVGSTEYNRTFEIKNPYNEQLQFLERNRILRGFEFINQSLCKIQTNQDGVPQSIIEQLSLQINEVRDYSVVANLTLAGAEQLRKEQTIDSVVRQIFPKRMNAYGVFPQNNDWSVDNFGPIYIPEEGKTIAINASNIALYKDIIREYEGNTLKVIGNDIFINDKKATEYTFKQDYYWMMGDNRHNSEDSRIWGYVPADHIVGKPVFVWLSIDQDAKGIMNKIRWDRLFTTVGGEGKPTSYLIPFLVLLGLYFGYDYFRSRRKKEEE
ncbi:MAG: signal peptidase I [Flavobacteriales bacterium]|nr:signal peptidase I [Flavobacteriales bacterium]